MSTNDFSLATYRDLLACLQDKGYTARGFGDAEPDARHLILRHDLDMSIQAAVPMAEVEAAQEMTAAYFVLMRTEMYNPASAAGAQGLRRLVAMGHTVGLHLDASLYANADALEAGAEQECAHLEDILGAPVDMISFHRPARHLVGNDDRFAGRAHSYMSRFTRQMGYCSDSRGAWHFGHPLEHAAVKAGTALQLLTHPIWWYGWGAGEPAQAVEAFLAERIHLLKDELAANCAPYQQFLDASEGR